MVSFFDLMRLSLSYRGKDEVVVHPDANQASTPAIGIVNTKNLQFRSQNGIQSGPVMAMIANALIYRGLDAACQLQLSGWLAASGGQAASGCQLPTKAFSLRNRSATQCAAPAAAKSISSGKEIG